MVAALWRRRSVRLLGAGLWIAGTMACSREERFVRSHLEDLAGVGEVRIGCGDTASAGAGVCATVAMSDGATLRFMGLGFQSFGPVPSRVRVAEAGGRSPLIVSCDSRAVIADVDRSGLFGHHFTPALDGVADAIRRHRDLIEELEFWPQCPQFWELQERQGPLYRYCAHATGAVGDLPPRPCDQSLDSAK